MILDYAVVIVCRYVHFWPFVWRRPKNHPELSIGKIPIPSKIVDDSDNLKTWSDITLRSGELYEVTSWIANFTYLPTVKFQYSRSKSKTRAKRCLGPCIEEFGGLKGLGGISGKFDRRCPVSGVAG